MSDLQDAVNNPPPPFPDPLQLAGMVEDEGFHGRLQNHDYGVFKKAKDTGRSVFSLLGGQPTSALMEMWPAYRYWSWYYRILMAHAYRAEFAARPAKQSSAVFWRIVLDLNKNGVGRVLSSSNWEAACRYWVKKPWGGLMAQYVDLVKADAEINWGPFPWRRSGL